MYLHMILQVILPSKLPRTLPTLVPLHTRMRNHMQSQAEIVEEALRADFTDCRLFAHVHFLLMLYHVAGVPEFLVTNTAFRRRYAVSFLHMVRSEITGDSGFTVGTFPFARPLFLVHVSVVLRDERLRYEGFVAVVAIVFAVGRARVIFGFRFRS